MEFHTFDRELSDAFCGGERLSRELRLTDEQARWLTDRCGAEVRPMGGQWYTVIFKEAGSIGA